MECVEAPAFTRHLAGYLEDEGYRLLQRTLQDDPDAGDVMVGTGGFRKRAIELELAARRSQRIQLERK